MRGQRCDEKEAKFFAIKMMQNNRRNVLDNQGRISHETAVKKVSSIYSEFRKKQDADYISDFDRETAKYIKGE